MPGGDYIKVSWIFLNYFFIHRWSISCIIRFSRFPVNFPVSFSILYFSLRSFFILSLTHSLSLCSLSFFLSISLFLSFPFLFLYLFIHLGNILSLLYLFPLKHTLDRSRDISFPTFNNNDRIKTELQQPTVVPVTLFHTPEKVALHKYMFQQNKLSKVAYDSLYMTDNWIRHSYFQKQNTSPDD